MIAVSDSKGAITNVTKEIEVLPFMNSKNLDQDILNEYKKLLDNYSQIGN